VGGDQAADVRQLTTESDHESYRWSSDLFCIAEGLISAAMGNMVSNVYAGIHEARFRVRAPVSVSEITAYVFDVPSAAARPRQWPPIAMPSRATGRS
jgi:hypothetical protein